MSATSPDAPNTSTADYLVVYCGDAHTYVCENGDAHPTYPDLIPIREEVVTALLKHYDGETANGSADKTHATTSPASMASTGLSHSISALGGSLRQLAANRDVVLVASTASSAYWPQLVRTFFAVGLASSVFVVSDVVATTLACGQVEESSPSVLVVQASWSDVTVSMVAHGFSRRYTTSTEGSLHDIVMSGRTPTSTHSPTLRTLATSQTLMEADYRPALIRTFGFRNYRRVLRACETRARHEALQKLAASGQGKGKGKGRAAALRGRDQIYQNPDGSRGEWVTAYDAAAKRQPGTVEQRLARVLKNPPKAHTWYPVLVTGEALQVPFYSDLLRCAVLHCGPSVFRAVARAQRVKERERNARAAAVRTQQQQQASMTAAAAMENKKKTPAKTTTSVAAKPQSSAKRPAKTAASRKRRRSHDDISTSTEDDDDDDEEDDESESVEEGTSSEEEEDDEEEHSSSESAQSSSASSSEEDEFDPTVKDSDWFVLQDSPIEPPPPWWPLVGGAVLARLLPTFDVSKMRISPAEMETSKGQIVYWKAVL